uniref:Retrovirus-related Pol polyprotein from transposon TNT 1-94 n=1 Tax=Tanacetum cinerariifolium TaxID=118510 RepID=A0A6L2JIQ1_TANCI|nr:retrovirus-related Pol polyprotein from transposon TNT 1-94 [Tanacetum cinerariifolium]
MAQQRQVLSKDLLVLVFKQYDLASTNKKIDLTNPPCPPASKILGEILRRHPLCFAFTASSSEDSNEMLTTKEMGVDQPPLHMMKMFYCIINNMHVDYTALIWEGIHYSLLHPTTLIPYPRFTNIIVDHILTKHLDIPKRLNESYHKVENHEVVKLIFNSRKKNRRGMRIPEWLLIEEMKQTKNYKVYAANFQIVISMTRSQMIKFTHGTHRTPSALRPPYPQEQQVSIATTRSIEEYEAQQAIKKVDENFMDEDFEKFVKGEEINANKFAADMLNSQEDLEESAEATLIRKKGKGKTSRIVASKPTSSLSKPKTVLRFKNIKGVITRMNIRYGYMFHHMKKLFMPRKDLDVIGKMVEEILKVVVVEMVNETIDQNMKDNLPMVLLTFLRRVDDFHSCDHEDHHDNDARPEGESSTKRKSTQEQQEEFDTWKDNQGIDDDDEVPSKELLPKLMVKILGKGMKSVLTTDDLKQMQDALNDMMRSRYDIMELVISCETAKATWTDLVHNFKGPSDTKENKIMDMKLEYQTFKAKSSDSISQTYTRYKTLLNELTMMDNEEVSDDEEMTQVKVLMALADDELFVGKNHACYGEQIDITMKKRLNLLSKYNKIAFELNKCRDDLLALKQAKLEAITFQIQNTELTKLNHALQEQLKKERKVNENALIVQTNQGKPYPPCTHCGFNDHHIDDCRNYPECEICESYDHFISRHNHVIHDKGGVLAESSQSSESSIGVSCTTYECNVHSTTDNNDYEHFKREHVIVVGVDNRPPMLEKTMYTSWSSRMHLYIKGKENGRMMLNSIDNGPLVYNTIKENDVTRPKKYEELTDAEKLQDDCNVKATNIIL